MLRLILKSEASGVTKYDMTPLSGFINIASPTRACLLVCFIMIVSNKNSVIFFISLLWIFDFLRIDHPFTLLNAFAVRPLLLRSHITYPTLSTTITNAKTPPFTTVVKIK